MSKGDEFFRQHEVTDMVEVLGQICQEFRAVYGRETGSPECFYLRLEGVSHHFFLNAGLLFWKSHKEPDPEHDLCLDGYYVNLGEELQVLGATVEKIHMEDCQLDIAFGNRVNLEISEGVFDTETKMKVR